MNPTCINCRTSVRFNATHCPACGIAYIPRTLRRPWFGVKTRAGGWGIPPEVYNGRLFRAAMLLTPLWLPLLLVMMNRGAPPLAMFLLLAPFMFIPGLYVVANLPKVSALARFGMCLLYVALAGIGSLIVIGTMSIIQSPF